ncbi:ficolin-1-like [Topomyia yanbarensis]|uniref:ficolin-1-like n=1 Tax=Topomyia yanbarensis TaxID=2498891 RepID=UPI00273B247F|nr:ficolin-1-like [Topomyia yanbarensis]
MKFTKILFVVVLHFCTLQIITGTQTNETYPANSGFGYELVLERLDFLEFKFQELFVQIKEQAEIIENNQRRIESSQTDLQWKLETSDKKTVLLVRQLDSSISDHVTLINGNLSIVNAAVAQDATHTTDLMEDLEHSLSKNMSDVKDYSRKILELQTICSNHDSIKSALFELQPKKRTNANATTTERALGNCQEEPTKVSGLYQLELNGEGSELVTVFCEQQQYGGGWLVIMQQSKGLVDFNRSWADYKNGFGDIGGDFWMGLEQIHQIVSKAKYELLIDMVDFDNDNWYARYSWFSIGGENEMYMLDHADNYSGSAGDSLSRHVEHKFTTFDVDNDPYNGNNAVHYGGGWWYHDDLDSHLTGKLSSQRNKKSLVWGSFGSEAHPLTSVKMMIRKYALLRCQNAANLAVHLRKEP